MDLALILKGCVILPGGKLQLVVNCPAIAGETQLFQAGIFRGQLKITVQQKFKLPGATCWAGVVCWYRDSVNNPDLVLLRLQANAQIMMKNGLFGL